MNETFPEFEEIASENETDLQKQIHLRRWVSLFLLFILLLPIIFRMISGLSNGWQHSDPIPTPTIESIIPKNIHF